MSDRPRRRLWPEKAQGAVSLSYDGGDLSHLETVAPCLDALCLHGTFYAPPTRVLLDPVRWRSLASAGHEIGDGSLLESAGPDGYLYDWNAEMVEADLDMADGFYVELFGAQAARSCAYPVVRTEDPAPDGVLCVRATQQVAMLRPILRRRFAIARTSTDGFNEPASCDLWAVKSVRARDYVTEELILLARQALEARAWVVFAFDGVGVGDPAVDAMEHAKFCLWLAENRSKAFVGTVREVGSTLRKHAVAIVEAGEGAVVADAAPLA